jgi:nucleotidyltransferase AbiEii toxin of type IV toxin-antitoxin system
VKEKGPNVGARAGVRLLRIAKERGDDFQLVLLRYAHERLLFRLASSPHARLFVLKGAALFTVWTGHPHRATRDREAGPFREGEEYGGVRIHVTARISTAVVRLQVDVGFGDAITPGPVEVEFPALLDFPAPRLRAYPRETVVAEKLEATVKLGLANSRMKDFYDLAVMSRLFECSSSMAPSSSARSGPRSNDAARHCRWRRRSRSARSSPATRRSAHSGRASAGKQA